MGPDAVELDVGGSHLGDIMTENAGIGRRAVLRGAAWSVPVLAAAVAVPAYAASGCADFSVSGAGFVATGSNYTATFGVNKAGVAQPLTGLSLVITLVPKAGGPSITVPAQTTSGTTITRTNLANGNVQLEITGATGTTVSFGGSFTGGYTGSAVWTKGACQISKGIDFGAPIAPFSGMNATLNAGTHTSAYLAGTASFTPPAGVAAVTNATLTFSVQQKPNKHVLIGSGPTAATVVSGAGWSFTSASSSGDTVTYVFTYTGSTSAGSTSSLSFRLNGSGSIGNGDFPITIGGTRSLSGTQFVTVTPTVTTANW
jgi:hypothetical protein